MKKYWLMLVVLLVSFLLDGWTAKFFALLQHPVLDRIMIWFSHEMTMLMILIILGALFMYQEKKTKHIPVLIVSFFASLIISTATKFAIMRIRPEGMSYLVLGIFNLVLRVPNYSFPSTHSAAAFSAVPILDKEFKKLKMFWIVFALMVAISRLYLNLHYLSDVVTGILLGILLGELFLYLETKNEFAKKLIGKI